MITGRITCPECGKQHAYLRLNVSIHCECGNVINRTEQLRQRSSWAVVEIN